jgi:DNA adenine methylase
VFFAKDKAPTNTLNDLDADVVNTLVQIRDRVEALIALLDGIEATKENHRHYKETYEPQSDLHRAFRWYYLNRTSYSGIMRPENCYWGYGAKYSMRPENWPRHLRRVSEKLQGVQLSSLDFEEVIDGLPDGTFMFVDPPYFNADQQKFYNCTFGPADHLRLAACLHRNAHRLPFLLTYDRSPQIRSLYGWAPIHNGQQWNYTINRTDDQKNGVKKADGFRQSRRQGLEIFIRNYPMSEDEIARYCDTYLIPRDRLLDILEDQKVLPMIRGKATEYMAAAFAKKSLNRREWNVEKLNLNPSGTAKDEDIRITFRRTGEQLRAETKNAVRGSFKLGPRCKVTVPHFRVKLHKSRSHKGREVTNDQYLADEFDLIMCNVSNALFRGKVLDPGLLLLTHAPSVEWLEAFYGVKGGDALFRAAYEDWRFCLPDSIAEQKNGYRVLPRSPAVQMENDPHWFTATELPTKLRGLIGGQP